MKVLYFNHSADLDGATQVLVNLTASLDSQKIEPLVLLPCDGPITERLRRVNVKYRIVNAGHCKWDIYHVPLLQMVFREEQPDCIHANSLESFPAVLAANLCGIPVVWHIHEMLSHKEYYPFNPNIDKFFPELVKGSSVICTASEASRKSFAQYCSEANIDTTGKFRVIHNGVKVPSATMSDAVPSRYIVSAIGNMVELKGFDYLIEGFASLAEEYPNIDLNIVGKVFPEYFPHLCDTAKKNGVAERVRFLTETMDIEKVYLDSHIIVCSSLIETFPMVVLEAMSYARPVVATDVGGMRELVKDGETGLVVAPKDAAALAKGIKFYLDHWTEAVRIGSGARRIVLDTFSLGRQAAAFAAVYNDVVPGETRRSPDTLNISDIKQVIFDHMAGESEKLFKLEEYFENLIRWERLSSLYLFRIYEDLIRKTFQEIIRQREELEKVRLEAESHIINDLRTLENTIKNFTNQLPFRLMRKIKGLISRKG